VDKPKTFQELATRVHDMELQLPTMEYDSMMMTQ